MRGTITIGDKQIEMVANGRTPHLYYRVFRRDFLSEMQKLDKEQEQNLEIFSEIAFIMAMQAQKSGAELINSLKYDDFEEWLEQFEAMDLFLHSTEIIGFYQGQAQPSSVSKKKVK